MPFGSGLLFLHIILFAIQLSYHERFVLRDTYYPHVGDLTRTATSLLTLFYLLITKITNKRVALPHKYPVAAKPA